jgi:hypothetical protein
MTLHRDALAPGRWPPVKALDPRRFALAAVPLASGAALVAYIAFQLPMPLGALFFAGGGIALWGLVLPRLSRPERSAAFRRMRIGILAGIPAVLAYDAVRYGVVAVASLTFAPFHVFALFGHAFVGDAPEPLATLVGLAYHITNGVGFAVAFALAVPRPSWRKGIVWALLLEACMLALYPGWLGLSLAGELLPVSLAGHLAYGGVLGEVAHRRNVRV